MLIRKALQKDIDAIVSIHRDAFDGFFLTSLGPSFLKLYYSCFECCGDSLLLVAEDNNEVVGFAATAMTSRHFNSRLIKSNLIKFGLLSIKLLFSSPKSLVRLVRNMSKRSRNVEDDGDYAELYSIGVSGSSQGKGIGKQLLLATEAALRDSSVAKVSLTTDYDENEKAISFYHSLGYSTLYEFVTYPERKMYRLIKVLR